VCLRELKGKRVLVVPHVIDRKFSPYNSNTEPPLEEFRTSVSYQVSRIIKEALLFKE
jgi:hypothetical protein